MPINKQKYKYSGIHSVTIKFLNWCDYSNTTNVIYQGWRGLVREYVYLYDVQVSTSLVDSYKDYNCFGKVSLLVVSKVSKRNKYSDWFLCQIKENSYWNVWNVEKWVRWRMFIENKCVWMAYQVQRRVRVFTRRWTERLSFNFQNRRIDRSHSKVFGQRLNFEFSDVRRNVRDQ
jgi:hypothetical protein